MTLKTRERLAAALDRHQNGDERIFPNWRAIRKEPRYEWEGHLEFVRQYKCLVCTNCPCDPHHIIFKGSANNHAGDYLTVPLCRKHHAELHNMGTNEEFERKYVVHFHSSIIRILKKHFMQKGWFWHEWQGPLHFEATVWANLQREANP